jgi:hypothetical protein
MKIASYLENNSLIEEFAQWFKEETGRDDFYLGTYTDGEAFIQIEGVEIPFRSAMRFMRDKQQRFNF